MLLVVPAMVGASAPAAGAAGSNTLTVTAGEYAYQLKGSPKQGWTTIAFKNAGGELHMMAVVRLKPGVTAKQLKAAALSNDQAAFAKIAVGDGQVNGVPQVLSPKQETTTITQLAAGHYGILCFVPAPDGQPHVAHGMLKVFNVAKAKSSLKPPTDGVVAATLTDTGITVPWTGSAPRHATVKVTNKGTAPHSFAILKIEAGKTLDEVKSYYDSFFTSGKAEATPPGLIVGGVSTLAPNASGYLDLNLTAGHYAYVSTEGEAPNDDYAKGLKGEFDVK
jgi:hypothetical protein